MNNYKTETFIIQNETDKTESLNNCTFNDRSGPGNIDDYFEFILDSKKVVNISIQAQPGLEFYINNNINPIIIGPNGLFSWEIKTPNTYIYSVKVKKGQKIKNKILQPWEDGGLDKTNGTAVPFTVDESMSRKRSKNFISRTNFLSPTITYNNLINGEESQINALLHEFDENQNFIRRTIFSKANNFTINLDNNTSYVKFVVTKATINGESSIDDIDINSLKFYEQGWPLINPKSNIIVTYEYIENE